MENFAFELENIRRGCRLFLDAAQKFEEDQTEESEVRMLVEFALLQLAFPHFSELAIARLRGDHRRA